MSMTYVINSFVNVLIFFISLFVIYCYMSVYFKTTEAQCALLYQIIEVNLLCIRSLDYQNVGKFARSKYFMSTINQ